MLFEIHGDDMPLNQASLVHKKDLLNSSLSFFKDIKLSHSIFALPFAATPIVFRGLEDLDLNMSCLLILCMVFARSFAMGMNRYLDRNIDKLNPRTSSRMIPSGQLTQHQALFWTCLMGGMFILCSSMISNMVGILSVPLLLILGFYSKMKNYSWLTHWYLGACLGLAPIAVSLALTKEISLSSLLLGLGIMMWTAGFDILYSLQDINFDTHQNLKSVPSKWGARKAIYLSRFSFMLMIICLLCVGKLESLGLVYNLGILILSSILFYEQWLVRDVLVKGYSDNINKAFFTVNGWVSIFYLCIVLLDQRFH